jgi:hypothetical protein
MCSGWFGYGAGSSTVLKHSERSLGCPPTSPSAASKLPAMTHPKWANGPCRRQLHSCVAYQPVSQQLCSVSIKIDNASTSRFEPHLLKVCIAPLAPHQQSILRRAPAVPQAPAPQTGQEDIQPHPSSKLLIRRLVASRALHHKTYLSPDPDTEATTEAWPSLLFA